MTSLPHASGLPQRQPTSRSGSRRRADAFPPPPKTVRIWQVQAQGPAQCPDAPSLAEIPPASSQQASGSRAFWVLLFLSGVLALTAWLFVFQFK
jgi:hypothetical protein